MAVGAEHLVGLARRILAEALDEREAGADNASDWARLFDQEEADTVVRLLAIMASVEPDGRVREAQLNAILEISESVVVGMELLHPLRRLTPELLDAEQLGYLDALGIEFE
ncbi:hypothetical protein [Sphaerisporangium rhizosphaerae]|uniref:Tetrapyrrole methyltransferase n=1 Tax=Sphaerisporangium rhizosphaerae TaxID=2269375 RepID=A0ABW2NX65_9ACTN